MNYLDCFSLFEGEPAQIAFFSTFQFDPDFFETRLLSCPTLKKARRIAVFMDARQWQELLHRDVRARTLNRRYLVVPVRTGQGVFHPKLNLLLSESGGRVMCGSNNLTRSGCSSNLELLNSIPFEFEDENPKAMQLASATLSFFQRAVQAADAEVGRIALEWIAETKREYRWVEQYKEPSADQQVTLVHTYNGPLWETVEGAIGESKPSKFFVISPFHDKDGRICKRLAQKWPKAKVEMLVQQGYTNLPIGPLKKLPSFHLSEFHNTTGKDASRRVHAKLIAWESETESGCLVGSANFTSAAFEGRNVEACLLIKDTDELIGNLFDSDLTKRKLSKEDFDPGREEPPESQPTDPQSLRLKSAVLLNENNLRITHSHSLGETVVSLRLGIRTPSEKLPRKMLSVPLAEKATETLPLPENSLADCKGTILATLHAELADGTKVRSLPVWIVQEERLTYVPGEGASSSKSRIETTGDGLQEYLDELGRRDGAKAVADYLRHLNIRFHDGSGRGGSKRKFRIRISDPYQDDIAPDWLLNAKRESPNIEKAISEFVERHIKKKLKKHSERGNINGMVNFLDIFTTLVKVLTLWHKRGVVKNGRLIAPVNRMLAVATSGQDTDKEFFNGYLYSLWDSLHGDVELLQRVCDENNYCGEIVAALLISQSVRYQPGEVLDGKKITRPQETLVKQYNMVLDAFSECDLYEPTTEQVKEALERYNLFAEQEVELLLGEI